MLPPPHDSAPWDVLYVAAGSFFFIGAVAGAARFLPQRAQRRDQRQKGDRA